MINADAIKWLENLKKDIGNPAHQSLWHYEQALTEIIDLLADRKTENSSENPNNCETCRFELYCPEMCEGCCEWDSHYEPKDEPQTCSVSGRPYTDCCNCEYFKCTADEPQTYGYMTTEQTADYRKMLNNIKHKVYGNVFENEPQTLEDAILYYENLSVQNHSEYYEQLAKWLLELRMHKAIKNIDKQSRKE